jgi:DNA-binding CsgD family transcriptional regulator
LDISVLSEWALLEFESGDFDTGAGYLSQLLDTNLPTAARPGVQYALPAQVLTWVARITGDLDRIDVAEATARTILSSPFAMPYYALWSRAGLGMVAVLRGDVTAAAEQYQALESYHGSMLFTMSSDHLLGLLAHTMGSLDQSAEHFDDALAFCRKGGYRPALAWTCCDYAEMLMSRKQRGSQSGCISLLDEAQAISSELGMRQLMQRVLVLRERAESLPARAAAYPDGLSHREVEVLRLIALGRSNAEIAGELFVSPNTVAHHVTNILNKTGTANRTEAATYAAHQRLM